MALNGQKWYGPDNTQEYVRTLESILQEQQRQLNSLISKVAALSNK